MYTDLRLINMPGAALSPFVLDTGSGVNANSPPTPPSDAFSAPAGFQGVEAGAADRNWTVFPADDKIVTFAEGISRAW
jgi:hypothetical protein